VTYGHPCSGLRKTIREEDLLFQAISYIQMWHWDIPWLGDLLQVPNKRGIHNCLLFHRIMQLVVSQRQSQNEEI